MSLHLSDFDFELPPELIAQHPAATTDREANAARRDAMRNLLYRKDS